jgi:hypothetical protein
MEREQMSQSDRRVPTSCDESLVSSILSSYQAYRLSHTMLLKLQAFKKQYSSDDT